MFNQGHFHCLIEGSAMSEYVDYLNVKERNRERFELNFGSDIIDVSGAFDNVEFLRLLGLLIRPWTRIRQSPLWERLRRTALCIASPSRQTLAIFPDQLS